MSQPVSINDSNFDQMVLQSKIPVLVDFWASWCKPCLMVAPILDKLAEEYSSKVNFFKIDVNNNPKTAARFGIMSIPSLIIFMGGAAISHVVGFKPKEELKRSLDAALAKNQGK